jgi:hypothetical protein
MTRIERLTSDQVAKFPEYVRKWMDIGTCTEPADRARAEAAICAMYDQAGLQTPDIVWCESPLSMALTKSVGVSVRNSVAASVGDSVWNSVGDSVAASVFGQHEASWLSFYDYFSRECGLLEETKKIRSLIELSQTCGWIMPYQNICFASERHDICRLDDQGVIHSETGPAVHYPDGFAVYAWHGVRVPADWINHRDTLDPMEVLRVENVEQRAAGCQIIGWPRMAEKLDRRIIDGDPDSDIGALIELTMPGLPEPGRFLQAVCPRNGTICEGVPRVSDIDGLPINTAISAQAWRDCLPASEYTHATLRT